MQMAPSLNLGAGNEPENCGFPQLKPTRATSYTSETYEVFCPSQNDYSL